MERLLDEPGTARMPGLWSFERAAWRSGLRLVAGVDEAGRGPLAGPVVAAAVILPADFDSRGINDSKMLTPEERAWAYDVVMQGAHCVGVGHVSTEMIDRINILQASRLAMAIAVEDLGVSPEICLLDGLPVPSFRWPQKAIVKGDSLSVSIAAASIVAKVTRDRLMCEMDSIYPEYGFARHKGYATLEHLQALAEYGVCPEHRRTFSPCAEGSPDGGVQECLLLDASGG